MSAPGRDALSHREQARQAAERRLKAAAQFAALHATAKPLFFKRMGKGRNAVIVRIDFPGLLGVYDPDTGRPLAVSEPGQFDALAAGFDPASRT